MTETALSPDEFQKRIKPTHLDIPESMEDLKEEVVQASVPKPKSIPAIDPRSQSQWVFKFRHEDGLGKVWEGEFTNKILSIRERSLVGITRARLAGGLPTEAIDEYTEELNLIMAHLMFSLEEAPDWAKDLQSLESFELLQAIYMEVSSHEAYFRGWRPSKSESKSESGQRDSEDKKVVGKQV